jgi:hypothetical protein
MPTTPQPMTTIERGNSVNCKISSEVMTAGSATAKSRAVAGVHDDGVRIAELTDARDDIDVVAPQLILLNLGLAPDDGADALEQGLRRRAG